MPELSLGRWLREARERAGLTQADAATHIQVSRATLSQWEHDVRVPDIIQFDQLARLYGAPWLFDRVHEPRQMSLVL